jgi:ssDNA-binding Zn-finger/Zn-ribbon topoisomerase 1
MAIERFTKKQFEEALAGITWLETTPKGMINGQEVYLLENPKLHVGFMLYSSIDHTGKARDNAEDSIRCCLAEVKEDGSVELIPGKVQSYVTRRTNWRTNLEKMLKQLANLAKWIQPCPVCKKRLRLKIKRENQEVYLFCQEDSENRDNHEHKRHVALTVLDFNTGEKLRDFTPEPTAELKKCPTCGMALRKVDIKKGSNAGKQAWTCPAKEFGRYLNHVFEVIETEENT